MKFNTLASAALCSAVAFSLAGCSSSSSASSSTESGSSITVWCWDENFNVKAMEVAKAMYLEENPDVEINVVSMSQSDIVQKLNTSLSSGNTSTLPEIVLIEDYRIQGYLTAYDGSFEDLSDIVAAEDFMTYKMAVNTIDDVIYGVPFDSGVAGLYYRTDILEEAGFTKEDMEDITWEDYIEIGKTVKEKTGKYMMTLDPSDLGLMRMMMQSAGVWYTDSDGESVNLENNTVLQEAMKLYKDMIDSGIIKQVTDWDSFVTAFQTGEVATVPTGCWISPTIEVAEDQSGLWEIATFPRMGAVESSVNATSIGGAGWYVIKGLSGSELAKDFLGATFASSEELMDQLAQEISLVSTLKAAADTPVYEQPVEFFSNEMVFYNFSLWSEEVPSVNYGLHTYAIEDIAAEALQNYMQGMELSAALAQAQKQAEGAVSY